MRTFRQQGKKESTSNLDSSIYEDFNHARISLSKDQRILGLFSDSPNAISASRNYYVRRSKKEARTALPLHMASCAMPVKFCLANLKGYICQRHFYKNNQACTTIPQQSRGQRID